MRILLLANNWGGYQITKWLHEKEENIVGLVIHPEGNQKFTREILETLNIPSDKIWFAPQLRTTETISEIRELAPDIIISAFFAYILKAEIIDIPKLGCINMHQGYLPKNRGCHENVWPILDASPAGVTIHYIDDGIDTGDIIAQRIVPVEAVDTAGSLHRKLTRELVSLFKETWPLIKERKHVRVPQDSALATTHRNVDIEALDHIDLDKDYRASDLLNILRAKTYPPYPSAYFIQNGRRIYVRVQLIYEDELDSSMLPDWD